MDKSTFMILLWSVCNAWAIRTQAEFSNHVTGGKKYLDPTIQITSLSVTDTNLELSWEIKNQSGQDAWILAGLGKSEITASVFMDKDDRSLLVRRRLDVPARPRRASFPVCNGRYVRLPAGETLSETISLAIPVHCEPGIGIGGREARGLEHASNLCVEIGYYTGGLISTINRALMKDEKDPQVIRAADPTYSNSITGWFGGLLGFNRLNELLSSRDDEVLIPYTDQAFTGEGVLRATVEDQHIPYEEIIDWGTKATLPDLTSCTRLEMSYQPSALEYFFPYTTHQSLLSALEKEALESLKVTVVENPDNIKRLADEVSRGKRYSGIVRQRSVAFITCYRNDERLASVSIYNNNSIVSEGRCRFQYPDGGLQSLRVLTWQVQPIEMRVRCSANLKNLWYRLRLYERAANPGFSGRRKKSYPASNTWCDFTVLAYQRATDTNAKYLSRAHVCPSADRGKCHYAMNPNCRYDSLPDMVLLFETKTGWNQHGGPELFTVDNHDPKGGCVLLNDGTVKFIRTEEELRQLRWK